MAASRADLTKLSREELIAQATKNLSKELLIELALQYSSSAKPNAVSAVLSTPTTSEVLAETDPPAVLRQRKTGRSGANLWKKASHQMHAYHAVTHQVQHRTTEKVGFGVAEHLIELVAEVTLEGGHVAEHTTAHTTQHATAHAADGVAGSWLNSTACSLRAMGPERLHCGASPLLSPSALRVWSGALEALKLAIPLAGTFLIAHMAHHDMHRAQHEQHKRGLRSVTTVLFYVAFACDTLDAIAHALIVTCMLAGYLVDHATLHSYHLDHHLIHEVHHAAMGLAVCATASMVLGEILSVRAEQRASKAQPKPLTMAQKTPAAAKLEQATSASGKGAKSGKKVKAH